MKNEFLYKKKNHKKAAKVAQPLFSVQKAANGNLDW